MNKYTNIFIPSSYKVSRTVKYHLCEGCGQEISPNWCGIIEIYTVNCKTLCKRCYNLYYGKFLKK